MTNGPGTNMMKLSLNDLKACRRALSDTINVVRHEAFEALEDRKITSAEFQDARDGWQDLQIKESRLQGLIMSIQLGFLLDTDVDSPKAKIVQATQKLQDAAKQIRDFHDFLGVIANVIEIFAGLVKALQNGTIASIASAIA